MPRNEEGEFELVLGNRQLLSVFFIVVVLLGVFFTMGYIVGRNSTPGGVETAQKTETKPLVVDSPAHGQPAAPPPETQPPAQEQTPAAQAQQPPATPPAVETAKPLEAARPAEQPKAPPKPERVQPAPNQPPAAAATPVVGQTYLQVAAVTKPDADLMVRVLGEKGFKSLSMEVPEKPGIYRVFVGPFKDAAAIAQARDDLQKAGFNGQGAIKKTF